MRAYTKQKGKKFPWTCMQLADNQGGGGVSDMNWSG